MMWGTHVWGKVALITLRTYPNRYPQQRNRVSATRRRTHMRTTTTAHAALPNSKPTKAVLATSVTALLVLSGCATSEDANGSDAPAEEADEAEEAEEAAEDADGDTAEAGSNEATDVDPERDQIHTAELTVVTPDVDEAAAEARDLTADIDGYVEAESTSVNYEEETTTELTLRAPVGDYEELLSELIELGQRTSLEREAEDVTQEVVDVDSRIDSAESSLDRLHDFLDDSGDATEMLEIEDTISERQSDLESLQARQESLADQTAESTVVLELVAPDTDETPREAEEGPDGFFSGLASGWGAFTTFALWIGSLVGWLLPFLLAGAAVLSPLWLLWRRHQRGPAPAPVPAKQSHDTDDAPDSDKDAQVEAPPENTAAKRSD